MPLDEICYNEVIKLAFELRMVIELTKFIQAIALLHAFNKK